MKRTLILTVAVLACALALCGLCQGYLNASVEDAQALRSLAVLAAEEGDMAGAKSLMVKLAEDWEDRARLMELMAGHDALHEVSAAIAEAQICLECEDHDDFLRTMSTADLALEHLKDEQAVRWANIY